MTATPPDAAGRKRRPDRQVSPARHTSLVQLFDSLVTSGLLARLSGNALKALLP